MHQIIVRSSDELDGAFAAIVRERATPSSSKAASRPN
jgi:hypothetical protein